MKKQRKKKGRSKRSNGRKEIQPQGNCERMEDCVPFLRQNVAAVVRGTVKDALNNARDGRKQFFELTGLKEHFSKEVFEAKKEARAFITTEFERDLLEGLRQLSDDDQETDDSQN